MAQRRKSQPAKSRSSAGSYAYEGLDRVLHEKARLGILTALQARSGGILFTDLKGLCSLTDGNLSRHVSVLQEAGLVEVWKGHEGRRPQTLIRMTAAGRGQFLSYLGELEQVIRDAKQARRPKKGWEAPPGWMPA